MYQDRNNNFPHGIMFHHFHDNKGHFKSQGSISKDDFYEIINFIGRDNILDADVFTEKLKSNNLKNSDVCFTFDDGIKSQIDVALPVLEDLRIKSFFFTYSSMFQGNPDNLEIFRFFRMNYFDDIDLFYSSFFETLDKDLNTFFNKQQKNIDTYKNKYSLYTINDIKFRLVRDTFLTKNEYEKTMNLMMEDKKFDKDQHIPKLFFHKNDLIKLNLLGHSIGLHSHNHLTNFDTTSYDIQKDEYSTCLDILSKIIKEPRENINSASYPLGNYNDHSIKVLTELGIEISFTDSMHIDIKKNINKINNSFLEVAREDHSYIIDKINSYSKLKKI